MLSERTGKLLDPKPFKLWLEREPEPLERGLWLERPLDAETAPAADEPEFSRVQSTREFVSDLIKAAIVNYYPC